MNKQDLLLKIAKLIQRSRQAVRVYSSIIKEGNQQKISDFRYNQRYTGVASSDFISDIQAGEWREVNIELLKRLTPLYDNYFSDNHFSANNFSNNSFPDKNFPRTTSSVGKGRERILREFAHIKEFFLSDLRATQTSLHNEHKLLIKSSENFDYVSAIKYSSSLVSIKTRCQALEAVCKELNSVHASLSSAITPTHITPTHTTPPIHTDISANNTIKTRNKVSLGERAGAKETSQKFVELSLENADLVQLLKTRTSSSESESSKPIASSGLKKGDAKSKAGVRSNIIDRSAEFKNRKVVPLYKYK